jgi:hypothetical protein
MNINASREPRIHIQHGRTFHRGTIYISTFNNSLPTGYVAENQVGETAEFSFKCHRVLYKKTYHFILAYCPLAIACAAV